MMDKRSEWNINGVHSDLVRVIRNAHKASPTFIVTEGLRTIQRQRALFEAGASKTMNSRLLTGHAVDLAALVDGVVRWDWPLYKILSLAVKSAAVEEKVPIIWGGDWVTFRDGPHYELDRKFYP